MDRIKRKYLFASCAAAVVLAGASPLAHASFFFNSPPLLHSSDVAKVEQSLTACKPLATAILSADSARYTAELERGNTKASVPAQMQLRTALTTIADLQKAGLVRAGHCEALAEAVAATRPVSGHAF
ncbi:MAG TPA: hypothetical protein VF292_02980 [Rhodanobacteraceae bacterium]